MSLNLPLQNLLQNTQHMCSFCVLGRPCQISSAVLIRPIRAFCPWNLAWIWHLSLIWTNHNKSLSFSCFISWETAYFGIFVKKLALFLEITSARRGTSLRQAFDMDRAVSQGKTEYSSTEHLLWNCKTSCLRNIYFENHPTCFQNLLSKCSEKQAWRFCQFQIKCSAS